MTTPTQKQIEIEQELFSRRKRRIEAEIDECEEILRLVRQRNPDLMPGEQVTFACAVVNSLAISDLADSVAADLERVSRELDGVSRSISST